MSEIPIFVWLLSGIGLILLILILMIVGILFLNKLKDAIETINKHNQYFQKRVLESSAIHHIGAVSKELSHQLKTTTSVISVTPEKLDQRVSHEITKGINPLLETLHSVANQFDQAHTMFQRIVMNLSEQGFIEDIATEFSDVSGSLKQLSDIYHRNEHTMGTIVEKTGQILEQWSEQRLVFENTYKQLAEVLVEWTQNDQIHSGEIEKRLFDRLAELGELESKLIEKFGELKTASLQAVTSAEIMQSNLNELVDHFKEISDIQKNINHTQIESSKHINDITNRLDHVLNNHKQHLQDIHTLFENLEHQQNKIFERIHTQQKNMIDNIEQQNQHILKSMEQSHHAYESFLKAYQQKLPFAANEKQQKVQTALLISLVSIQSIMCIILIYMGFMS